MTGGFPKAFILIGAILLCGGCGSGEQQEVKDDAGSNLMLYEYMHRSNDPEEDMSGDVPENDAGDIR